MFTSFTTLFSGTHRGFVLVMVIVSMVLGMLWYGPMLFGSLYQKRMGITKVNMKADMTVPLIGEAVSKLLYFVGLQMILDNGGGVASGVLIWLCFVFATILSQTVWSPDTVDKRIAILISGKVLLDTILAGFVYNIIVH